MARPLARAAVWAAPDELDRFALPAAQQRIAALALEAQGRQAASAAGE